MKIALYRRIIIQKIGVWIGSIWKVIFDFSIDCNCHRSRSILIHVKKMFGPIYSKDVVETDYSNHKAINRTDSLNFGSPRHTNYTVDLVQSITR